MGTSILRETALAIEFKEGSTFFGRGVDHTTETFRPLWPLRFEVRSSREQDFPLGQRFFLSNLSISVFIEDFRFEISLSTFALEEAKCSLPSNDNLDVSDSILFSLLLKR